MKIKFGMRLGEPGPATRIKRLAACCLLLGSLSLQSFAQDRRDAQVKLPDLSVGQVYPKDFGALVSIVNGGTAASGPCEVTMLVYDFRGTLLWQEKQDLRALSPRSSEQLVFTAGRREWAGRRFQVLVDSGNTVKELSETNNRTTLASAPLASAADPVKPPQDEPVRPPKGSATVDLGAINIFPAIDGKKKVIQGVIRNLGKQRYSAYLGQRQATITLAILKDGEESQQTLGTEKVPDLSAGDQQAIDFPSPAAFDHVDGYRLTLTISGGDSNAGNDTKVNTSAGFSLGGGSPDADLEATEVTRILEGGTARIKGVVRNLSSQRYKGDREVHLYVIDQSGSTEKSTVIASRIIKNVAAGEEWEIIGDLPVSLKKLQRFRLRLSISPGDANSGNDEKTRPFGNL